MIRRAYAILAHEQPDHLRRLCDALDAPGARCFVHFDKSRGPCPVLAPNAYAVPNPIAVNHGGFSLSLAMVKSLRAAMEHDFDVVVFLSGRDYPITPDRELVDFLEKNSGTNFINFYPLARDTDFYHHVSQRYFVDERSTLGRVARPLAMNVERISRRLLPIRRFPFEHTPYRGSAFFALSRRAAAYVLGFLETPVGHRYAQFFRHAWGSDEMLFQTILLNSKFAGECRHYERDRHRAMTNENQASLHYIDWNPKRERPAVLDERDLDRLVGSDFFFARKFDENRSKDLLQRIDRLR